MYKIFFIVCNVFMLNCVHAQIEDSLQREVKFDSAINFRDIGGYETSDGKHVKWGKIYRSAAINKLSDNDLRKLESLKISIDADFRGPAEVKIAPDKIPNNITRISLPAGSENVGTPQSLKSMFANGNLDSSMLSFYENIEVFKDRYKPVFDELLRVDKDSAILFHCSAGKDRTGIAAALILYALGVPENTIMEDYLASNYYRQKTLNQDAEMLHKYFNVSLDDAKKMSMVRDAYLIATYNTIIANYGSVDSFLSKELGIGTKEREILREKFLD